MDIMTFKSQTVRFISQIVAAYSSFSVVTAVNPQMLECWVEERIMKKLTDVRVARGVHSSYKGQESPRRTPELRPEQEPRRELQGGAGAAGASVGRERDRPEAGSQKHRGP